MLLQYRLHLTNRFVVVNIRITSHSNKAEWGTVTMFFTRRDRLKWVERLMPTVYNGICKVVR